MFLIIKNCFNTFIVLLIILIVLSLICRLIFDFSIFLYPKIQQSLIMHSNNKNHIIIGKLLVLNYRIYNNFMYFILTIKPFKLRTDNYNNSSFNTKFCSSKTKRNLFFIFISFICSIIITLGISNFSIIKEFFKEYINVDNLKNIVLFFSNNKWFILSILGILLLLYGVLKDKFTNKIITEIQDEELKKIINTHKNSCKEFRKLYKCLCENIDAMLATTKYNGKIYALASSISNEFNDYKYNKDIDSFEITDKNTKRPYVLNRCKEISEHTDRIKSIIKEFNKSESFHNTNALNKYVHGLKGFDISYFLRINNKDNLICKEFLEKELNDFDTIEKTINNKISNDNEKIQELNDYYNLKNKIFIEAIIDTIEYTVDIDNYIKNFTKCFALKTRRKSVSFDEILKFK